MRTDKNSISTNPCASVFIRGCMGKSDVDGARWHMLVESVQALTTLAGKELARDLMYSKLCFDIAFEIVPHREQFQVVAMLLGELAEEF